MKILLPKTLAEPLTIPWVVKSFDDVSRSDINKALHDLIDDFERRKIMPKTTRSPTEGIRTMLRVTAEDAGAHEASASSFPMIECKTHVGYTYTVLMSLPNDKNLYHWYRKSWFSS